mmetsp:Transcript_26530/g.69700  ORF Transcript_26530/g.69700 Transcript_26530/m.69700 type:complete len:368 (-) Transcript_26530:7-1110(-)
MVVILHSPRFWSLGVERHLKELLVHIFYSCGVGEVGLVRDLHAFLQDCTPVQPREPGVILHLLPVPPASEPRLWIPGQQTRHHVPRVGRHVRWVRHLTSADSIEQPPAVARVERWQSSEHLVDQSTRGVPVDGFPMTSLIHDLWCEVLGRAAHGSCGEVVVNTFLAQTKVGELHVAFGVEENILGLEVPVDDGHLVQIFDGEENLGGVEPATTFGEASRPAQVEEQLATRAEFENEEELLGRLERVVKGNDERMRHRLQHIPLRLRVFHLVSLHDVFLAKHLHREDLIVLVLHKHHLAVRTLPNDLQQREIVQRRTLGVVAIAEAVVWRFVEIHEAVIWQLVKITEALVWRHLVICHWKSRTRTKLP